MKRRCVTEIEGREFVYHIWDDTTGRCDLVSDVALQLEKFLRTHYAGPTRRDEGVARVVDGAGREC